MVLRSKTSLFAGQSGGIEQRWLIVESQQIQGSDLEKLDKKTKLEKVSASQKLNQLNRKNFESIEEALVSKVELLPSSL